MELFKILGKVAIDGVDEAKKELTGVAQNAEKSESKISAAFKKIGTAVVTYFAVDKIRSFGYECVSMASDVEEMENKFNVVFSGMTDEVDAWATEYADAIGRNRNTIKGYLADNQNMFVGMGMTRDEGAKLSEQMISLSLDLASFNNLNEDDAVNAMSKALMGETESAKQLGAVLNDNTRALAMEALGYEGKYNELTEAQKMEVNYQAILMQSQDAIGDCERSLDSYKGRQIQATAAVENLKEKIGTYLLPVMTKFQEAIAKVANWLSNHLDPAVRNIKEIFEAFKKKATEVGDYASKNLYPIFQDLGTAFEAVKEALQPFIDALVEYVTSGELAEDVTNSIKVAIDILAAAYEVITDAIDNIIQGFKDAVTWGNKHKTTLTYLAIAVGTFTSAIIANTTAMAINKAGGIAEIAQLAILKVQLAGLTIAQAAHTAAVTVGTAATSAFAAVMAFLTSPITLVVVAIGALIAIIYTLVKNWDDVSAAAKKCWETIKGAFESAGEWFNNKVVKPITNFFSDTWSKIKQGASNAWEGIKNTFKAVPEWFEDKFKSAWEKVKKVFSTGGKIFNGIKEGITSAFTTIVNGIIKGINKVIAVPFNAINDVLKKIKNVSIMGAKPFSGLISTISVPEIPTLWRGGVLEKGELGLLEGDGAEAVVPLENNKKWISAVAEDMESAFGGKEQNEKLDRIVEVMENILEVLPNLMDGVSLGINNREFGRLVRQVT